MTHSYIHAKLRGLGTRCGPDRGVSILVLFSEIAPSLSTASPWYVKARSYSAGDGIVTFRALSPPIAASQSALPWILSCSSNNREVVKVAVVVLAPEPYRDPRTRDVHLVDTIVGKMRPAERHHLDRRRGIDFGVSTWRSGACWWLSPPREVPGQAACEQPQNHLACQTARSPR